MFEFLKSLVAKATDILRRREISLASACGTPRVGDSPGRDKKATLVVTTDEVFSVNKMKYVQYITDCLAFLSFKVKYANAVCFYDVNHIAEDVYCDILGEILDLKLENANNTEPNASAIDLIDKKKKVIVQVSSQRGKGKVDDSLSKIDIAKYKGYRYAFLCIADDPPDYWNEKTFTPPSGVAFDCPKDVYGPTKLSKACNGLDIERARKVYELCRKHFGTRSDGTEHAVARQWVTRDDLHKFIAITAPIVSIEMQVRSRCDGEDASLYYKKKINSLILNQLNSLYSEATSEYLNIRMSLVGAHSLLEELRLLENLHISVDRCGRDDASQLDVAQVSKQLDESISCVARILEAFARELRIDKSDLVSEFMNVVYAS